MRVVIYPKRVHYGSPRTFQLDRFSPDDERFDYSVVTTHKALSGPALWDFIAGRGAQEKSSAELKGKFALNVSRPTTTAPTAPGSSTASSPTT